MVWEDADTGGWVARGKVSSCLFAADFRRNPLISHHSFTSLTRAIFNCIIILCAWCHWKATIYSISSTHRISTSWAWFAFSSFSFQVIQISVGWTQLTLALRLISYTSLTRSAVVRCPTSTSHLNPFNFSHIIGVVMRILVNVLLVGPL